MDVILHIGMHRTGTTMLQEYLRRNANRLRERHVIAMTPAALRHSLLDGLILRPAGAGHGVDPGVAARADTARRRLCQMIDTLGDAGADSLILSDENISGNLRHNLTDRQLYADIGARLRWLGPEVAGRLTRVAIGLRSYEDYWASAMAFAVAAGWYRPASDDTAALAGLSRGWGEVVADVALALPGPEILVWPSERLAHDPNRQLAAMTGRPSLALRLPPGGVQNGSLPAPELRRRLIEQGDSAAAGRVGGAGRWMPFDEGQRLALSRRYADDLAGLGTARGRIRVIAPRTTTGIARKLWPGFAERPAAPWRPPEGGQRIGDYRERGRDLAQTCREGTEGP